MSTVELCLQQFGFRPGHSTELAALKLVNHVISEMDNCNIPTNIYIDLSKAFDTLNFDILLNKLDYYGVQGCANRLIYSYLSERWQFVDFSGHKSSYLPIKTGVPQGSVLGPLLFLIYINDLPLVSNVFDMLMYADDTTLYCNINQNIGEELINAELTKLWEWLGANKLSLNIAKTKYMAGMRFFRNFPEFRNFADLRGHSRGNPRSGLIFMGGGGGGGTILCLLADRQQCWDGTTYILTINLF